MFQSWVQGRGRVIEKAKTMRSNRHSPTPSYDINKQQARTIYFISQCIPLFISHQIMSHCMPRRREKSLYYFLLLIHFTLHQLTHCSRTQVIKFEQGRNLPKEFVQEERGVHKSFYRAEQQGSSSKQVSSSGMPREGFPMANESTTQRPPKMVSIRVHAHTHQSMHTHARTHTRTHTHTHTHKHTHTQTKEGGK